MSKNKTYLAGSLKCNSVEEHIPSPVFKRVFDFPFGKENVKLRIFVAGFYRLFLGGEELTKGMLAPYICSPDAFVYGDEYDISEKLKAKGNVLRVVLGNALNNALDNGIWDFEKATCRRPPCFRLEITAGDKIVLESDENFLVRDGAITFSDLRAGERYDALREEENPDGNDFSGYKKPFVVDAPAGEERICQADPIVITEEIPPVRIIKSEKGYVYDFGVDQSGVCRLKLTAPAGREIRLVHGETLCGNEIDMRSVSFIGISKDGYIQEDRYVCKDGFQTYTPSFTYHGFRYVYVEGITAEQATKDLLTFVVFHSDVKKAGKFSCSDETLNKIQECAVRSDESNFHYFLTDCPHREKNGWTGDTYLSAEQVFYNFAPEKSFEEWLRNVVKAQTAEGKLPGIVPTTGWGYEWGNGPVWDCALVEVVYEIYRFTGYKSIIGQNAEAIKKYFSYVSTRKNEDGLLAFGLGDWCEAGTTREDLYNTPLEVTDTLTIIENAEKAAFLFAQAGDGAGAEKLAAFAEELKTAFLKKYVRNGKALLGTQTGLCFAIYLGILPPEAEKSAYKSLIDDINANNGKFKVGVVGAKYLFKVLSRHGDGALAMKIITDPKYPSYAYNLSLGATTLWEAFNEYEPSERLTRKDGNWRILSFNHHFWGSISMWFYEDVAGLKIISSNEAEISPDFSTGLSCASAERTSGDKRISVKWEKRGDEYFVTVENKGYRVIENIDKSVKYSICYKTL